MGNTIDMPLYVQRMMHNPAIAADGYSYERVALEAWLLQNSTSPMTGQPLPHKHIVDIVQIRNAIARHRKQGLQTSTEEQLRYCF